MNRQNLCEWLAWLERAHPSEIDLGLERIRQVADRLSLGSDARVLTVAGTNGKGSCVTFASALIQGSGRKVGTYTSPHILHYCERVRIDGVPVSEAQMCEAFTAVDEARGEVSLTYFEFGTLAALWLFARHQVDVMVLEVGLGGRLDAVNIIDADVAVITSIALDHEAWLGSDREAIGREKAGIARSGRPLICADREPPESVLSAARHLGAPVERIGVDFEITEQASGYTFCRGERRVNLPSLHLPAASAAAAIVAVETLGIAIDELALVRLANQTQLPGRMQRLRSGRVSYMLDVAHNPAATEYLAAKLRVQRPAGRLHCVFAVMADKDIDGVLAPLTPLVDTWYLAQLSDVPRAAAPEVLADRLANAKANVVQVGSMATCLAQAAAAAGDDDLVLVCGSFFTVSAALALLVPDGS